MLLAEVNISLSTRFSEMVSPLQALEKGECEQLKAE
jgi:hypothetical protein